MSITPDLVFAKILIGSILELLSLFWSSKHSNKNKTPLYIFIPLPPIDLEQNYERHYFIVIH